MLGLGPGRRPAVEHVVVIVKENRPFAQLFGGGPDAQGCGLTAALCNPGRGSALGRDVPPRCACRFPPQALPLYRALAARFTLGARHFTEVRGPSDPNHYMLMAAQSPTVGNLPPGAPPPDFETLADRFAAAGLTWRNYAGRPNAGLAMIAHLRGAAGQSSWEAFATDAAQGSLPHLSWLTPPFAQSEHPPTPVPWGEVWTARQLAALMASPDWGRSVAFVVWDDWGGFADELTPPVVERWSDGLPFRYGRRCPLLVVSPFARRGFIYQVLSSHVSLAAFCEAVFGLPPLTKRDAAANPLLDCFDWGNPDPLPLPLPIPQPGLWERLLTPLFGLAATILDF